LPAVKDYGEEGGFGICFNEATVGDICFAVHRAITLFNDHKKMEQIVPQIMQIDHSWEKSAEIYINLYNL
jgi:starch synthase